MEPLRIYHIGSLLAKQTDRTLVVTNDVDYCTACASLRENVGGEYDAIWVREKYHFIWLRVFAEHVGLSHLRTTQFGEITAKDLLGERWGLLIPEWLTDELILAEDLLNQELPSGRYATVEAAFLASLIGPMGYTFPVDRAGVLAEKASASEMLAKLGKSKATAGAWNNILSIWAGSKTPSWVAPFCERLRADPRRLWRDLTVWRLLHGYPNAQQEFALEPAAIGFVRTVPTEALKGMSLNPDGQALATDQIELLFKEAARGVVSRERFEQLLAAVSGELKEEFVGLEVLLEKESFRIERRDIEAIAHKFAECAAVGAAAKAKLEIYIRPSQPRRMTSVETDAAAWETWFHAEYLPYRRWQMERGEFDSDVEETVEAFTEWYCREFVNIHSDPTLSNVQTITSWRDSILRDQVSMILLVDNLPWFFWHLLQHALRTAGFYQHESQDRFAPLPSHTSICKPALISGRWETTGSDYRKMLETRSADEWGGRPVHYLTGVDQLRAIKDIKSPTVYLVNYLAGDEALHSDASAAGPTRMEQLNLLYTTLASTIGELARRLDIPDKAFGLYVVTDHGASCILEVEKRSVDAKLSQRLFPNEKHRSATLSKVEAEQVPENLWDLGFRFSSPSDSDGTIHFIPRGHNTVALAKHRPLYCHGGAAPEEVIIPAGIFRLFPSAGTKPNLRFLDLQQDGRARFYVKRIANLEIEIHNPNADDCRLESVTINPPVGDIRDFGRVSIGARAIGRTTVSLYFAAAATAVQALIFDFTFRVAQETIVTQLELPVAVSSATAGGINLSDLS